MERAVSDMHMLVNGEDPTIKIGFAGRIKDLTDCLYAFKAIRPHVQYDLNSDIENVDYLDINDFDVLIYPDEPRYARFSGYRIGSEKYYLAVNAACSLAKSAVASPALLQGQDFVFLRRGKDHIEYPYRICTSLAVNMNSQSFALGMAVGFVPEGESRAYGHEKDIRLLPILDERFSRPMNICFKREKHLSKSAREFRDLVMERLELS